MHVRTNKHLARLFKPIIVFCEWLGVHHPILLARIRYFARFHKRLDLETPKTLNEKILFLCLKTDTTLWTKCTDKYLVRNYVKECGLESTLVKLYGVWDHATDVDFDKLPRSFVMKGNHGCGDVLLVSDKTQLDKQVIITKFEKDLKKTYGALESGHHYMRIKPRLIAEELLVNDEETKEYSKTLIDYKFWCFNGKPYFVFVCNNRSESHKEVMVYDMDWNDHPEYLIFDHIYIKGKLLPKPKNFESMVKAAEKLSAPFPEVRTDLYNIGGRIYFGELTFTSYGGLMNHYSDKFQKLAGNLIDLSKVQISAK